MKCRNINTELVYNISACRNISQSLSSFGIGDDCSYVLVAIVAPTPDKIHLIRQNINGDELVHVSESLVRKCDFDAVRIAYNIEQHESEAGSLLDSIVTRISCRD